MINLRSLEKPWLMVMAMTLLAAGLVVDLAITQPKIQELKRLKGEQDQLHADLSLSLRQRQDNEELLRFMAAQGLSLERPNVDPASFLGMVLEDSKVERVELRAVEASEGEQLRRSQFTLRILGDFDDTLDFVRSLETDPRLVVVDAIRIEPSNIDTRLETRLNLSVYDPKGGA